MEQKRTITQSSLEGIQTQSLPVLELASSQPTIRSPGPVLNPLVSEWIDIETVDREKINVILNF